MKYAVIRLQGHQYQVSEGEEILVDRLGEKKPEAEILLLVDDQTKTKKGEEVKIGKPEVKGAKIKFKVLGEEKGKKIYVQKFKAKSRYRKKTGFRAKYTKLRIEKIS